MDEEKLIVFLFVFFPISFLSSLPAPDETSKLSPPTTRLGASSDNKQAASARKN